jgi:flagellar hook-associated protein 1 FlgK
MSLSATLNIGKTALAVQQAAIQVTGNNIANAGNADYSRQTASIAPTKDRQFAPGTFIGTGVDLSGISRQVDDALAGRLRGAIADDSAATTTQQWLTRVEAVFNELSDDDLSTQLSTFFKGWSDVANKPQDNGLRQVVVQNGESLANWFHDVRGQLGSLADDVNDRLTGLANDANNLAQQIADINGQIVIAEGGTGGVANGLRDQRDALLKKLSELMDVKTVMQPNGVMNVYAGSEPLVLNSDNRGVAIKQEVIDGKVVRSLAFKRDGGAMKISGGQIGGLVTVRSQLAEVTDQVDTLAGNLIFELNKAYSSGQGLSGFSTVSSSYGVDDTTAALNTTAAGLEFAPANGSFVVHVKDKVTGQTTSTLVQIDLDGLNGDDTTLDSLSTDLAGVTGINASVSGGRLTLATANANLEISFSQDNSGTLAALGINTFFSGYDAGTINVQATLKAQPTLLSVAKNGEPADNQTALAIAALETAAIGDLGGQSIKDRYQATLNQVAVAAASSKTAAEAATSVRETLEGQREALSGVSLDEEAINLIRQQRAFQGAARLISAVDEMMRTLLSIT